MPPPDSLPKLPKTTKLTLFISAAEPSADRIGANLIQNLQKIVPDARFFGVTGTEMAKAGCESLFDMSSHAAMLLGALRSVGRGWAMLRTATRWLRDHRPDAVVVIDSPALHLPLAGRAGKLGLPVLYYVAPQLWAWGAGRIRKLRKRVDHLAAILPFEEEYFQTRGVPTTFVGHPLGDVLASEKIDESAVERYRARGSPVVALLPGSRTHVIESLAADQLRIVERLHEKFSESVFLISAAHTKAADLLRPLVTSVQAPVSMVEGPPAEMIAAADLVLAASGTTTLEVAMRGRPMIVMYQASRLAYQLVGRWMIRTRWLSLPNILAQSEIVPEFMPYYSSIDPIVLKAGELLASVEARAQMVGALDRLTEPLRRPGASRRAAELVLELAQGPKRTAK